MKQRKFSIVEIQLVVLIIVVLMGIVGRYVLSAMEDSKRDRIILNIEELEQAIKEYRSEYSKYPYVYDNPDDGLLDDAAYDAMVQELISGGPRGRKFLSQSFADNVRENGTLKSEWDTNYKIFVDGTDANKHLNVSSISDGSLSISIDSPEKKRFFIYTVSPDDDAHLSVDSDYSSGY